MYILLVQVCNSSHRNACLYEGFWSDTVHIVTLHKKIYFLVGIFTKNYLRNILTSKRPHLCRVQNLEPLQKKRLKNF